MNFKKISSNVFSGFLSIPAFFIAEKLILDPLLTKLLLPVGLEAC